MLFHVTATHTPDDCPGYNRDKLPELFEASKGMPAKAQELGIKVLFQCQRRARARLLSLAGGG